MFITVLITVFLFQFNYAVEFTLSAKKNATYTMDVGDVPIILKVYDVRQEIRGGKCTGTCTINGSIKLDTTCNFIDIAGSRHLNILIQKRAKKSFSGSWQCNFAMESSAPSESPIEYFNFNVEVKSVDLSQLPLPSILLPIDEDDKVEFNITSPNAVNNFTLDEGNRTVVMFITGMQRNFGDGQCEGWCDINEKENITTSSCSQYESGYYVKLQLNPFKVTKSHGGIWACSVQSTTDRKLLFPVFKLMMAVKALESITDVWLYVGIALGVLVILFIIIGQTICIIHFKTKAKKAEINKNLTPNKTVSDNSPADVRYVKKVADSGDVRESVIYEALDTVKGAPIPPPIETLPVTPKPEMSRSISQNNLSVTPHERFSKTSPRVPKNQQSQGKFNTVDRMQSLERIRNRPPLPTPDEVYEVMAPGDSPGPTKSSWFKNKSQEQSPLLLAKPQKKTLFGKSQPIPSQEQRVPTSPNMARKPGLPPPGPARMQTGPSGPGLKPVPSGRPPAGAAVLGALPVLPSMISAANLRPVKKTARPPDHPRMPENAFRMPLDTPRMQGRLPGENMQEDTRMHGNFRTPQDTRMPESMRGDSRMQGFRMPQDTRMQGMPGSRIQESRFPQPSRMQERMPGPQDGFRMPVDARNDQPFTNSMPKPNPGPVPFTKPKPPVPLPSPQPEPIEPEYEPEIYYGSSDEEFDCYDVLPEYRIYGNAPPKKLQ